MAGAFEVGGDVAPHCAKPDETDFHALRSWVTVDAAGMSNLLSGWP